MGTVSLIRFDVEVQRSSESTTHHQVRGRLRSVRRKAFNTAFRSGHTIKTCYEQNLELEYTASTRLVVN